ncbi:phospholipase D-like domain-containing protein [Sphingobium subterraneum]|uniref:Phospholipase D n=1 Tax=Sphingobium subterraneum TaxID=627688 RepID=A0A841J839_9SPHN|nr:phosphatidylserine/phosphatidylglycerophosphate/cardiolipin synthase family protein [Sphingobium subterraneum]MBB6124718.1 cardiolipin synthase [Sphingobium subterraneum]
MASRISEMDAPCHGQAEPRLCHSVDGNSLEIIANGPALREALIALINGAERSLQVHYYIFADDKSGRKVMAALIRAARRGVAVRLIVDAFGSSDVPPGFFTLLQQAGGEMRWFGAGWSTRYLIRNHQKMTIVDGTRAIIGGFNVSDHYFGIPEDNCWHDLGLVLDGPEATELGRWYDALWQWLGDEDRDYGSLRHMVRHWHDDRAPMRWLIGGPTHRLSPWARSVRADLETATRIDMVSAYFAPGEGLLRRLRRVGRRGTARLILASKSDNTATVAASRLLYGPLLRAGVQIYEYQPCRLHMKLIVIDDAVYIGSANFDMRSLFINLELMLRIEDSAFADAIRTFIDARVADSRPITRQVHEGRSTPLRLLKGWISYLLVAVLDYTVTRRLNFRTAGRD